MRISDADPGIEIAMLETLEREIGAVLPDDYRAFLAEYNGGRPEPRTFRVPSHEEEAFDVQILFGLSRATESSNLGWNLRQYQPRVGANFLPIACTDTNDLVLLELAGEKRGRIVFWDSMESSPDGAVHEISRNFREFLDALSDIDAS